MEWSKYNIIKNSVMRTLIFSVDDGLIHFFQLFASKLMTSGYVYKKDLFSVDKKSLPDGLDGWIKLSKQKEEDNLPFLLKEKFTIIIFLFILSLFV